MKIEKITPIAIQLVLVFVYLADGVSKFFIQTSEYNLGILPNRYLKIVMVVLSVVFMLIAFKKLPKAAYRVYALFLFLFLIFMINRILYDTDPGYFIKYSCYFLFAPVFFLQLDKSLWERSVINTFKYIVYLNFIFIIFGLLSDFYLFRTYYYRFGYNGLLITPMQSTYFYISAIFIALKMRNKVFFAVCLISSLLIGTKILLGFLTLIGIYLIFYEIKNIKYRIYALLTLVAVSAITLFVFFNQKLFKEIIENKGELTAMSSLRNKNLISTWNDLSLINYNIFTGGISLENYRVEMEIIDVLLFFGLIGLIVFFMFFKLLKDFFVRDRLSLFYFSVVLIFMIIGGNFLYYPINCLIFLITLKSLYAKSIMSLHK